MRVHEFAKVLSTETGKVITSSQLLVILSKKKEGMRASSTIDDELMAYARAKYMKPVEKKPEPNKHQKPAERRPGSGTGTGSRYGSGAGTGSGARYTAGPRQGRPAAGAGAGAGAGAAKPRVRRPVTGGPIKPSDRRPIRPAVRPETAEKVAQVTETPVEKPATAPVETPAAKTETVAAAPAVETAAAAPVAETPAVETKEAKTETAAAPATETVAAAPAAEAAAEAKTEEAPAKEAAPAAEEKPAEEKKKEHKVITGPIQEKQRPVKLVDAKTIAERIAASQSKRENAKRTSAPAGERGERGDRGDRGDRRPRPQGDRPGRPQDGQRRFDGSKDQDRDQQRGRGPVGGRRNEKPDRASADVPAEKYGKQDRRDRHEKNSRDKDRYDKQKDRERTDITSRDQLRGKKGQKVQTKQKAAPAPKAPEEPVIRNITLPESLTLKELADKIKQPVNAMIKKLFMEGKMVTVNTELAFEDAALIAMEYNYIAEEEEKVDLVEEALRDIEDPEESLTPRPPVVCVMGHVDHGKTSLLDAIRNSSLIQGEAGGITQHIGAYVVKVGDQRITFLDTPGHEAFTAMRLRGAQATDIAILVVAADDGVMPQTVEAINHAKAAGIEIIVAINKIDKPSANVDRVKQELMEYGLVAEDWGGSTVFCPVSAHTHEGISNLLDMILLTADVLELKANANRRARGVVIEARLDRGRGPVATLLVQKGTLHVGDFIAIGETNGRVRAMIDHKQRSLKVATPSTPVEITGLTGVPNSGDTFISTETEKEARQISEAFITRGKENLIAETKSRMSLDDLFNQMQEGNLKELKLIIKADVQGSVEAVKQSLLKLSNEEILIKCIHSGVGAINESDVTLASASGAIIIGFNVRPDAQAKHLSDEEKVDVRLYSVIYNAIDDIENAMKGMLDPIYEEKVTGHAEIRQVYKASGIGSIAGSYVLDGVIERSSSARITRDGEQIFEGKIASLKRFKDDVKEVKTGYECGIVFENHNDVAEGDQIEIFKMVEVPR